jgi:hypothetical protein
MIWMIPLTMAALGAMADKKNPVRGAAIGAGVGMTGGLLAPAAAGAAGAGSAATGAGAAGLLGDATAAGYGGLTAADAATMGGGASVAGGSALGTTGASTGGLLGTLGQYAKPASQAMQLAGQSGLLGGHEQPQPSPFIQPQGTGPQVLAQLAQQGDPSQMLAQEDLMRRKRRMGLLGREVA